MGVYGLGQSWNESMGERRETQSVLQGRERGTLHLKHHSSISVESLDVWLVQLPSALSLSPCLYSLFSMQGREGHSHCGRDATVAAAWLLEP